MPAYNEDSLRTITVPSSSGVLSDEQYYNLTPNNYKLDSAISTYNQLIQKNTEIMDNFSESYNRLIEIMDEDLGIKFFSLNNKDVGLLDSKEEILKKNNIVDNISTQMEDDLSIMESINSKLGEVDNSLQQMNAKYQERKQIIDNEISIYNQMLSRRPQRYNYGEDEQDIYNSDYSSWSRETREQDNKISRLEQQLKEDCNNTKNSINISWFCNERGGM